MPKPYPKEFREDVVRVARNREPGVTLEQIVANFGVHPITLSKWLRRADTDECSKPATAAGESAELREARKRIRLLEQENGVLRRGAVHSSMSNTQRHRQRFDSWPPAPTLTTAFEPSLRSRPRQPVPGPAHPEPAAWERPLALPSSSEEELRDPLGSRTHHARAVHPARRTSSAA
ncbi:transposase [Streptomyces sp. NPDC098077]|uniref:transposase n=1 Tax=Streptomyces sp. NPDC098077 TaxID=3366093 RepID=UPI003830EB2A